MTRKTECLHAVVVVLLGGALCVAAEKRGLVSRQGASGTIVGYKDTPLLPSTGGKYHVHDPDRPEPKYVDPGPAPEKLWVVSRYEHHAPDGVVRRYQLIELR